MSRKRKRQHQSLFLLDRAATSAVLRQRLAGGRWWLIVLVNAAGVDFLDRVERGHYFAKGSKGDFEMMAAIVDGLGSVAVGMGRKRRLSAKQLGRLFDDAGMPHQAEAVAKGRDVIVLARTADAGERAAQWLSALVQNETAGAR